MKNLCDKEVEKEVLERLVGLRPDAPALWGKMNAAQMLCHVTDQFRMAFGEIKTKDVGNFFQKSVVKFLVLNLLKESPKEKIKTLAEIDQYKGAGTKPADFEQDVQTLKQIMQIFAQKPEEEEFHPHGVFGKMNKRQWGRLAYLHLDHHFRQFGI